MVGVHSYYHEHVYPGRSIRPSSIPIEASVAPLTSTGQLTARHARHACTAQEIIEQGRIELRTPLDALVELVWQWQAPDWASGGGQERQYHGHCRDADQWMATGGAGRA